jgi:hypothetical protein
MPFVAEEGFEAESSVAELKSTGSSRCFPFRPGHGTVAACLDGCNLFALLAVVTELFFVAGKRNVGVSPTVNGRSLLWPLGEVAPPGPASLPTACVCDSFQSHNGTRRERGAYGQH